MRVWLDGKGWMRMSKRMKNEEQTQMRWWPGGWWHSWVHDSKELLLTLANLPGSGARNSQDAAGKLQANLNTEVSEPLNTTTWNPNCGILGRWLTPVIPALREAKVGGSPEARRSKPAWATWWNPVSTKNTKISQAWWWVPVILATQEAEAKESLEPERRRLQWAEIMPLHSSLGDRGRPGI